MNYYVIDDTPDNLRRIRNSINALSGCNFYYIDKDGIAHPEIPSQYTNFPTTIEDRFVENLMQNMNPASDIVLVDLALNNTENDSVKKFEQKHSDSITLTIAAQIIRKLKETNDQIKIRVISRITKINNTSDLAFFLNSISTESWFPTIKFIKTSVVCGACKYEEAKKQLEDFT